MSEIVSTESEGSELSPDSISLTVEPSNVILFKGPYTKPVRVQFHLRNPTDEQIAFKVKCIDPKRYHVRPASGTVEAANSAMIMLELRPIPEAELADFLNSLQAFLIQTVIPRDGETSDIKEIFRNALPGDIGQSTFRCVFDDPTAQGNETVASSDDEDTEQDERPEKFVSFMGVITSRDGIPRVESSVVEKYQAKEADKPRRKHHELDEDDDEDEDEHPAKDKKDDYSKKDADRGKEPVKVLAEEPAKEPNQESHKNLDDKAEDDHKVKQHQVKNRKDKEGMDFSINAKSPQEDDNEDGEVKDEAKVEEMQPDDPKLDDQKPIEETEEAIVAKQSSISTSVDAFIPRRKRRSRDVLPIVVPPPPSSSTVVPPSSVINDQKLPEPSEQTKSSEALLQSSRSTSSSEKALQRSGSLPKVQPLGVKVYKQCESRTRITASGTRLSSTSESEGTEDAASSNAEVSSSSNTSDHHLDYSASTNADLRGVDGTVQLASNDNGSPTSSIRTAWTQMAWNNLPLLASIAALILALIIAYFVYSF